MFLKDKIDTLTIIDTEELTAEDCVTTEIEAEDIIYDNEMDDTNWLWNSNRFRDSNWVFTDIC